MISVPSAPEPAVPDALPGGPDEGGASESKAGVLGVGLGLLLIAGLFAWLVAPRGRALDGAAVAAEFFPEGTPAGYGVVSAHALPTGERMLRLTAVDGDPPAGTSAPEELVLVRYGSNGAAEADMLGGALPGPGPGSDGAPEGGHGAFADPLAELDRWERERDFAMHLTTERGELAWGGWRAARATERSLRADGTWREAVRVNLSQPGRYLLLFALWPPDVAADPEALRPILQRVAMRSFEG